MLATAVQMEQIKERKCSCYNNHRVIILKFVILRLIECYQLVDKFGKIVGSAGVYFLLLREIIYLRLNVIGYDNWYEPYYYRFDVIDVHKS